MVHRPSPRLQQRRLIASIALVTAFAAAFLSIFFLHPLVGIIASVVIGWIGYQVLRLLQTQSRSYLETTGEGVACRTALGEAIDVDWQDVTEAGLATDPRGKRYAYVYSDSEDKLLTLPDDYSDFDLLVEELSGRFRLRRFELRKGQSVQDWLRAERQEREEAEEAKDDQDQEKGEERS
jgi:hypothetical protein